MLVVAIIMFFFVLYTNVNRHYRLWLAAQKWPQTGERVPIDHDKEFVLRLVLMAPAAITFFSKAVEGTGVLRIWPWIVAMLALLIIVCSMIMFTFWFLFNGFFNRKRDREWFFEGTIDKDEAKSDDFLRGKPVWQKLTIQLGGSLLFIGLYIWFYLQF
jgi:hypothetical protein